MTPEELKEARGWSGWARRVTPFSINSTPATFVQNMDSVADTITRLCDEVERLRNTIDRHASWLWDWTNKP